MKELIRECLIDDKIFHYDVCSSGKLKDAKKFFKSDYSYIGSSYVLFINKKRSDSKTLHHFFIKNS